MNCLCLLCIKIVIYRKHSTQDTNRFVSPEMEDVKEVIAGLLGPEERAQAAEQCLQEAERLLELQNFVLDIYRG